MQLRVAKLRIVSEKTVSTDGKQTYSIFVPFQQPFYFKPYQSSQSLSQISEATIDANLL